jgi:hypothetical protein
MVCFFDCNWAPIARKDSYLVEEISAIIKIAFRYLKKYGEENELDFDEKNESKRVDESIPSEHAMLFRKEEKAFYRLQLSIIKGSVNESVFAAYTTTGDSPGLEWQAKQAV